MERLQELLMEHAICARLDEIAYERGDLEGSRRAERVTVEVRAAIIDHVTSLVEAARNGSKVES